MWKRILSLTTSTISQKRHYLLVFIEERVGFIDFVPIRDKVIYFRLAISLSLA